MTAVARANATPAAGVRFGYLADAPQHAATLARWYHGAWGEMLRDWSVAAAQAELETHRANVEVGEGRLAQCLKDHAAELSPACDQALTNVGVK